MQEIVREMKAVIEQIHRTTLWGPNDPNDPRIKSIHDMCDKVLGHDTEYHKRLRAR